MFSCQEFFVMPLRKHRYLLYLLREAKDNAIPRECLSEIIVEEDKAEAVKAAVEEAVNEIREEFCVI